jgi:transcription factor C subunit 6
MTSESFHVHALIWLTHFRDFSCAARYLPTDTVLTEDGQLRPPAPVNCYLGPYGRQTRVEMAMFDSHATCMLHYSPFADVLTMTTLFTAEYVPGGQSFVFNAGAPAWGADWCPTYSDDRPCKTERPFPKRHRLK